MELVNADVIEPEGAVKATVGFFIGCMYNMRLPKAALDAIEVLKRNGIRVDHSQRAGLLRFAAHPYGYWPFSIPQETQHRRVPVRNLDTVMTMCAVAVPL